MVKFSLNIFLFDLAVLILAGIPVVLLRGYDLYFIIFIAMMITSFLAIASYYPFTRMKGITINKYMSTMMLGMLIRMVFIGASVAWVFTYTDWHKIGFTVALLISYICKSAIETYTLVLKQRENESLP